MDILINGERIDVTLEEEKTVGEVVNGVRNYITSSGFLITGIQKDGEMLSSDDTGHWAALPIDGIEHLGFTAIPPSEYRHSRSVALFRYLSGFARALEEGDPDSLAEIAAEYSWFEPELTNLLGGRESSVERPDEESGAGRQREEHTILAFLDAFTDDLRTGRIDPERQELARTVFGQIMLLLTERIREFEDPMQELRATLKCLAETVPEISDVSLLLQTGKDREAMANIIRFTELSAKLLRLYPLLTASGALNAGNLVFDGSSFQEYYTDLNRVLLELLEAFRAQDSVLIGDLLEYEIAPRIDRFLVAASS